MRKLLTAAACGLACSAAVGQTTYRSLPLLPVARPTAPGPCLPVTPPGVAPGPLLPVPGSTDPVPGGGTAPDAGTTPTAPTPDSAGSGVSGGGGEGGSGSLATSAPNMYGDAFSGRALRLSRPTTSRLLQGLVVPQPGRYEARGVGISIGTLVNRFEPHVFNGTSGPLSPSARLGPVTITPAPIFVPAAPFPVTFTNAPNAPLVENAAVTRAVNAASPGETARFNSGQARNGRFVFDTQSEGGSFVYDIFQSYTLTRAAFDLIVPSPSGGTVGRTKVSDDNSPIPRDRVILNFDYFDAATVSANGAGVSRYSLGFEKTFLDQNASVEVRLPFAATLDSSFNADGSSARATEFGNVNVTLKGLLYRTQTLFFAGGVGVGLPTGEDVRVQGGDGNPLVRIRNDAVVLTPYVAALYATEDGLFAQAWAAYGIDANGNRTLLNPDFGGSLVPAGRFTDQNLAQFDGHVGYWLFRAADRSAAVQGLAPFVELHYNATVGKADVVSAGVLRVGGPGSLNELNLTLGVTGQFGPNFLLSAGLVVPLKDNFDRTFDYQFGLRGSWFFGPTARSTSAAQRVQSF